jgi:predicted ATPase
LKISIRNFGPISQYTFDIDKDFHLIVGENSVGKSYAIKIVYLILKNFLALNTSRISPSFWLAELLPDETNVKSASEKLSRVSYSKTLPASDAVADAFGMCLICCI